jgi:hypothetical protein
MSSGLAHDGIITLIGSFEGSLQNLRRGGCAEADLAIS